jgi:hypothetical protein
MYCMYSMYVMYVILYVHTSSHTCTYMYVVHTYMYYAYHAYMILVHVQTLPGITFDMYVCTHHEASHI